MNNGGNDKKLASAKEMQLGRGRGCATGMRQGLRKVRNWAGMKEACTIVNKTGKPVVVRAKFKDVWEGQQWRLAAEGGQMVVPAGLLKSSQPYCRLGAFLELGNGAGHALYITSRHLLASPRTTLSLSPSHTLRVNQL